MFVYVLGVRDPRSWMGPTRLSSIVAYDTMSTEQHQQHLQHTHTHTYTLTHTITHTPLHARTWRSGYSESSTNSLISTRGSFPFTTSA
jgi:hypothetical protein